MKDSGILLISMVFSMLLQIQEICTGSVKNNH